MVENICFFTTHYDPARQVLMEYYERTLPEEIDIFLVSINPIEEKYKLKRTTIEYISGSKYLAPVKLRRFLKKNKIDLIVNMSGSSEVALAMFFATFLTDTKEIFYVQGNPRWHFLWFFSISQFFTKRFLFASKEIEEKFKILFPFASERMFYLPNPIDVHKFKKINKTSARKKLGLSLDDKIIVQIGRIENAQGSDYLAEIVKRNPDKKFIFIGKIKDENIREIYSKNLKLIEFIPHEETIDYYNAADLSLFLTKRNSYPFPQRESISCGTPVIVFDIGAFKVMETSAVIKSKLDLDDIQNKIDRFFSLSEKAREKISQEGRDFIKKDSSEEVIKPKALNLLLNI